MEIIPKHHITAEQAIDLINNRLPLIDYDISGEIKLTNDINWSKEIIINNCIVEHFNADFAEFEKPIKLINTHFKDCQFTFSYFYQGVMIDNCVFDKYLDFHAGGHNKIGHPVIIKHNIFSEFVNFFDCWYTGEVIISENQFLKGTNIESQNQYLTFDIKPIVINNVGQTNLEIGSLD